MACTRRNVVCRVRLLTARWEPQKGVRYFKSLGVDYAVNVKEKNLFDTVREITGGMGANVTVDAVCNKKVLRMRWNSRPPQGIVKKELTIYGSRLQTKRFPVVIDYLKQGKLPLEGFVSKVFPMDQMVEAFDYTDKNNATIRKVVVSFE